MKIETTFSPGDIVWCVVGMEGVRELEVGQVHAIVTDSPGRKGETLFRNYMPQKDYKEQYMCVETGIGSGNVYTLGESIFATENEARSAWAKWKDKML